MKTTPARVWGGYRTSDPSYSSIPTGARNFSLPQGVQTGCGACPAAYLIDFGGFFLGIKWPWHVAHHSPPFPLCVYTSAPPVYLYGQHIDATTEVSVCLLLSITNKTQRYIIFFIAVNALHVSGGFPAHHQELINCTHSTCYMSSLLAVTSSVGELELQLIHASGSSKQAWHISDAVCTVLSSW
jgi:hypothetical protein